MTVILFFWISGCVGLALHGWDQGASEGPSQCSVMMMIFIRFQRISKELADDCNKNSERDDGDSVFFWISGRVGLALHGWDQGASEGPSQCSVMMMMKNHSFLMMMMMNSHSYIYIYI
jgi:hypothetical protein